MSGSVQFIPRALLAGGFTLGFAGFGVCKNSRAVFYLGETHHRLKMRVFDQSEGAARRLLQRKHGGSTYGR